MDPATLRPARATLTLGDLQDLVQEMRSDLGDEPGLLTFGLASLVAVELLGNRHGRRRIGDALWWSTFFKPDAPGRIDMRGQYRHLRLGEALFNLQTVPHFRDWIRDLKPFDPQSHEPPYVEVDAAAVMHRAGLLHGFRRREGTKRVDYDCDVIIDGVHVACDVKAKVEKTSLSARTFQLSVRDGLAQLPRHKPGLIWVHLPQAWFKIPELLVMNLEVAMQTVRAWNSSLIGVVTHWEEFRMATATAVAVVHPCGSSDLAARLDSALATSLVQSGWITFDQVVAECLGGSKGNGAGAGAWDARPFSP